MRPQPAASDLSLALRLETDHFSEGTATAH